MGQVLATNFNPIFSVKIRFWKRSSVSLIKFDLIPSEVRILYVHFLKSFFMFLTGTQQGAVAFSTYISQITYSLNMKMCEVFRWNTVRWNIWMCRFWRVRKYRWWGRKQDYNLKVIHVPVRSWCHTGKKILKIFIFGACRFLSWML